VWARVTHGAACSPRAALPSPALPSLPVHLPTATQSAAKRYKVSGSGKVCARHSGKQHMNEKQRWVLAAVVVVL
jgi:hypothetical protein